MATEHHLMTADELAGLPADNLRHELVQGELRTMTPSFYEHGKFAGRILVTLGHYVEAHDLGEVFAAEAGYLISKNPDTVLAPDGSYIRKDRLLESGSSRRFFPGAPDLVVEVVSSNDRPREVREKTELWLASGASIVWLIYPEQRAIEVCRLDQDVVRLGENDTLQGDDVVPGFTCPLSRIFR